jgi:subtilisin family serine protease/PKD repeat protein
MRVRSLSVAVLVFTFAFAATAAPARDPQPAWVPGQLLVKYKTGAAPELGKHGVKKAKKVFGRFKLKGKALQHATARGLDRAYLIELDTDDIEPAMKKLKADPKVEYAEPNYYLHLNAVPNDPSYASQWALANIGAPLAWDSATSGSGVVVGVVDTGISVSHPDLAANLWVNPGEIAGNGIDDDANGFIDDVHGWNFAGDNNDVNDTTGHGTHVAGIIGAAGNNAAGITGVSWSAKLAALRIGGSLIDVYAAVQAIEYANMMGFKITSNSWGWSDGGQQFLFDDVVAAAEAAGHLFVVAAGNDARNTDVQPEYPAHYTNPNVVSVTASNSSSALSSYGNYGAASVDLAAPGDGILSTLPGATYGTMSGSSMATPHVAGAAALFWTANPSLTHAQVRRKLMLTSHPQASLWGKTVSGGRLSLANLFDSDANAPAAITNLSIGDVSYRGMTLQFTAPGDDGTTGRATRYDVRVSESPITAANVDGALELTGEPMPQASGTVESFRLNGLAPSKTYYVIVRALDNAANAGQLSNVVTITTPRVATVFEDNMQGSTRDWTVQGTDGNGGPALWKLGVAIPYETSTARMWRYNDAPSSSTLGDYDTGFANWGALVSPEIDLTRARESRARFRQFIWTERRLGWDMAQTQISVDGGPWTTLLSKNFTLYLFQDEELDLSAYDGHRIRIRFFFDTIDAIKNQYQGWSVDDVIVEAASSAPRATAVINGPYGGAEDTSIALSSAGSSDPEGASLEYKWDFGDGEFAYTRSTSVSHVWKQPGTYTVKLVAYNGSNDSNVATTTVTVTPVNDRPVAGILMFDNPPYADSREILTSPYESTDEENAELTCRWDFGDGTTYVDARCTSLTHSWDRPGVYRVTLIVNDGQLDSLPDSIDLTIQELTNDKPIARPGGPYDARSNVALTLNGSASSDEETSVASYLWTFHDGTTSTAMNPSKTYTASGSYTATLVVTDATGVQSDPVTATVHVCGGSRVQIIETQVAQCAGSQARIALSINGWETFALAPWTLTWSDGHVQTINRPLFNGYYAERLVTVQSPTTLSIVSAVDRLGCPMTIVDGTVQITPRTPPRATVYLGGSFCPGTGAQINVDVTSDPGYLTYTVTWSDGVQQSGPGPTFARLVSPSAATTYTVTQVSDWWCSGTSTGSALVAPGAPWITAQPQNKTIAKNTATTLSVTSPGIDNNYQWYQGPSGTTTTPVGTNSSTFITPKLRSTTQYWVKIWKQGCTAPYTTNSQTATVTAK